MTEAHARIDSLKEDIREIGYSVLDLQAKARAHDAKLEQVMATQLVHAARFDGVDARLDSVGTRLDALAGSVNGRFDAVDRRFGQIGAQLTEMLARLPQGPE